MDRKNRHFFKAETPLFREKNLVFKTPDNPQPISEKTREIDGRVFDKIESFVAKARPGIKDKEAFIKDNPYANKLMSLAKKYEGKNWKLEEKAGKMEVIVKDKNGKETKTPLGKYERWALDWENISKQLTSNLKGKNISPKLIRLALQNKQADLEKVVGLIATGKAVDAPSIKKTVHELDHYRTSVSPLTVIARKRTKAQIESQKKREALKKGAKLPKKYPVTLPTKVKMKPDAFAESDLKKRNEIDPIKLQVLLEGQPHINAQKWKPTTVEGVKDIYRDLRALSVPVGDTFYSDFFATLQKGVTNRPADAELKKAYLDPFNNLAKIEDSGPEGARYASALNHLKFLRGMLNKRNKEQLATLKAQGDLDKDKVAEGVTDFVRDNFNKFRKSIRERDYATAGMYALGIFAIYKSISAISKTTGGGKALKWLTYGAAVYAGNAFLKNAGYDVLKMAGFRDPDFEVSGTPMEAMRSILQSNPDLWEDTKDLDYGVVLRSSEMNLKDLDDEFRKSNEKGVRFIDPRSFPRLFPGVADVDPFQMGLGEKGLSDYTGMSNVKLSPNQREFVRLGQQIYKMAISMEAVYNVTLKKDHKEYRGEDYQTAINDDTRKLGKVRHLLAAVQPYSEKPGKALKGLKKSQEAWNLLKPAFANLKNAALYVDPVPNKNGHFTERLMIFQ